MTVATYGVHAENAAHALGVLLGDDQIPIDEDAIVQLLRCREVAVDALRQRLFDLGRDSRFPPPGHPAGSLLKQNLTGLNANLASVVCDIALSLPKLPADDSQGSVAHLAAAADPTVDVWRVAAIELLSASHALSTAEERPWLVEPGAGWWVMRDIAVALEALVVLDSRLAEVGLMAGHDGAQDAMGLDEKRLVLSQAARVASWHASNASPEEATPRLEPRGDCTLLHPVVLVRRPGDLAAAQLQLSRFLRPFSAGDSFYDGTPEIAADSARHITSSQLGLCRSFAKVAGRSSGAERFEAFFLERCEVLDSLQAQVRHLADLVVDKKHDKRCYWQQVELTTALARMAGRGMPLALRPTQMADLAEATHLVTLNLGRTLRRELLRKNSNLVDAHPRHSNEPVRVGRRSVLAATVTDLVNLPDPPGRPAECSNARQRAALQRSLDLAAPSQAQPPTPFPVARAATCGTAALR